ncbi:MAG: aminoglycoside phosphotransferase family protein [Gemmatimonadota bacterium]
MSALPLPQTDDRPVLLPRAVEDSRSARLVAQRIRAHLLRPGYELVNLTPVYSRFKGDDGGLVTYRVELLGGPDAGTTFVSVRTGSGWRLESQAERFDDPVFAQRTGALEPFHLDARAGILLVSFPMDRGLRHLHRALRPKWIRRWLEPAGLLPGAEGAGLSSEASRVVVVSYRPERRAVLRLDPVFENSGSRGPSLFLRMHADPSGADRAVACEHALAAAGLDAPRPLGRPRPDLAVESGCSGVPVGSAAVTNLQLMRALGRLLARVHAIEPPAALEDLPIDTVPDQARRCAADLERVHPGLGAWALSCVECLGPAPGSSERVLLHGDLHLGQVLIDGARLTLVDWDRGCAGDPAYDLGTLAAHLYYAHGRRVDPAFQEVVHGYRDAGRHVDEEKLRWHHAQALLRLVNTPFRSLRPDWPERTEWILARLEEVVGC